MENIKITTPENIEIEYKLASVGMRACAFIVDFALQIVAIAILFFTGVLIYTRGEFVFEDIFVGWGIAILLILYFIIIYGYFIIFELTMRGQTPGKRIFGLRAIRDNGQPISIQHSLIRNLFRTIIDMYGVGCVMIFFTKNKRRLGDKIASTIVVIEDQKQLDVLVDLSMNKEFTHELILSKEEQRLLKDYCERKDANKIKHSNIEVDLARYFSKKLDMEVIDSQEERFLRNLMEKTCY